MICNMILRIIFNEKKMKEKENLKYLKKSKLKNQKVWDKILLRQSDNQSEK